MRRYDSLKKLFVLGVIVWMLAGNFPIGSLTGNEKVGAAEEIGAVDSGSGLTDKEPTVIKTDGIESTVSQDYVVTDMSAILYVQKNSNVPQGPSTDYEVIGGLALNQEAVVTGRADTGWYRIEYKGGEGFVAGSLLGRDQVVIETPAPGQSQFFRTNLRSCQLNPLSFRQSNAGSTLRKN